MAFSSFPHRLATTNVLRQGLRLQRRKKRKNRSLIIESDFNERIHLFSQRALSSKSLTATPETGAIGMRILRVSGVQILFCGAISRGSCPVGDYSDEYWEAKILGKKALVCRFNVEDIFFKVKFYGTSINPVVFLHSDFTASITLKSFFLLPKQWLYQTFNFFLLKALFKMWTLPHKKSKTLPTIDNENSRLHQS